MSLEMLTLAFQPRRLLFNRRRRCKRCWAAGYLDLMGPIPNVRVKRFYNLPSFVKVSTELRDRLAARTSDGNWTRQPDRTASPDGQFGEYPSKILEADKPRFGCGEGSQLEPSFKTKSTDCAILALANRSIL